MIVGRLNIATLQTFISDMNKRKLHYKNFVIHWRIHADGLIVRSLFGRYGHYDWLWYSYAVNDLSLHTADI